VAKEEARLNRSLTPSEYRQLRDCTTCVAIPEDVHRSASRTYGGRNAADRIQVDSKNSSQAAQLDADALRQSLVDKGYTPEQVDAAFNQRDLRNSQDGRYQ